MESLFQHFRKEEKEKIVYFHSKFEIASRDYYSVLLDFTNPRERKIIDSVAGQFDDVTVYYYGGGNNNTRERMRALLVPEMLPYTFQDFDIATVELKYPKKFVHLTHRNILGAIMSLQIDRSKIGDIIVDGEQIQFAVDNHFLDFFNQELTTIKNAPIELINIPNESFIDAVLDMKELTIVATSFRLDVILSQVLKEGRNKSKNRVVKEKVKVNHGLITDASFQLELDDIVSVRGFGRFIISDLVHETRKGKFRIEIQLYND